MTDISVVIPLFNKEETILNCLKSISAQTVPPDRVIIVDDGSTDNSLSVVKTFITDMNVSNFQVVEQENQGVSAARNNGAALSQTGYVAFLDADDEWLSKFIEEMCLLKNQYKDAILLTCRHKVRLNGKERFPLQLFGVDSETGIISDYYRNAIRGSIVHSSKVVVKREVFIEIGGFPVGAKAGEDLYLWSRLYNVGDFAFTNYIGMIMNQIPDENRNARSSEVLYILEFYSKNKVLLSEDLERYLLALLFKSLLGAKLQGDNFGFVKRLNNGKDLFGYKVMKYLPLIIFPGFLFNFVRNLKR